MEKKILHDIFFTFLTVEAGARIAQLVIEHYSNCGAVQVESIDETDRGAAGFGSTGMK